MLLVDPRSRSRPQARWPFHPGPCQGHSPHAHPHTSHLTHLPHAANVTMPSHPRVLGGGGVRRGRVCARAGGMCQRFFPAAGFGAARDGGRLTRAGLSGMARGSALLCSALGRQQDMTSLLFHDAARSNAARPASMAAARQHHARHAISSVGQCRVNPAQAARYYLRRSRRAATGTAKQPRSEGSMRESKAVMRGTTHNSQLTTHDLRRRLVGCSPAERRLLPDAQHALVGASYFARWPFAQMRM